MLYGALTEHSERKVCSPVEPSSRACWQSWDPRVFTSDTKLKTTSRIWVQDVLTLARTHKLVPPPPNTHTEWTYMHLSQEQKQMVWLDFSFFCGMWYFYAFKTTFTLFPLLPRTGGAHMAAYNKYSPWCDLRLTSSESPTIPGSGSAEDLLTLVLGFRVSQTHRQLARRSSL